MSRTVVEEPVSPAVHRLAANLIFSEEGLQPYHGIVSQFEPDLTETADEISPDSLADSYEIDTARYWEGKIADPERDGGLNEYKLALWDTELGEKGADFTFRPGLPNATHSETGEEISGIPDDCPESVRVQVEATNLESPEVLALLQELANALGLAPRYFDEPHEWSSAYAVETYARLERETAKRALVGSGGMLERIAAFANGGGRGAHKWDHEEETGHYEAVSLDPETWENLLPETGLARRIKCYQPDKIRSDDSDDPLRDHKLECQYWSDYQNDSIPWTEVRSAVEELRETVLSVAFWSGVDVNADADVWTPDRYFQPSTLQEEISLRDCPLDELQEEERLDARSQLIDPSASESEFEVLRVMTDGGSRHYERVAEELGAAESTVYRAAEQFDEILQIDGGEVGFISDHVRETISGVLSRYESARDKAESALSRIKEKASPLRRGRDDGEPSALERWLSAHAVDIEERADGLTLFFSQGQMSERKLVEALRSGLSAARSSMLEGALRDAQVYYTNPEGVTRGPLDVINDSRQNAPLLGGYRLKLG